jgi:hypothetical protein
MFRSSGAALRSAQARYGNAFAVYRCETCATHHITSQVQLRREARDPLIERLAEALLGRIARFA